MLDLIYSYFQESKEQQSKKLWWLFELYACYKNNIIPWNLIHVSVREQLNRHGKDYGIDGLSEDLKTSLQAKYRNNSYITFREISTFYMSSFILKCNNLILSYTDNAKISVDLKSKFNDLNITENEIKNNKQFIEEMKLLISAYSPLIEVPIKSYELRPYQIEALNIINNIDDCKLSIFCGLGKTIIINEIAEKVFLSRQKIVIFVPKVCLLDQTYNVLSSFVGKKYPKIKIQRVGTSHNKIIDKTSDIFICVYNSAKYIKNIKFNTIVLDEAHHLDKYVLDNDDSEKNSYLKTIYDLPFTKRVYLSATFNTEMKLDYSYTMEQGIENKYLTDYDIIIPVISEDSNISKCLVNLLNNRLDLNYILAYCNSRDSGLEFCELLKENNITAVYIDGNTVQSKRQKIIKDFEKGKYRVLVSVYVLSEGIDIPRASVCMFVDNRHSSVNVIQCVGRILRLHPEKSQAHVILPTTNEFDELSTFLKIIQRTDSRVYNSIENRRMGGRIVFESCEEDIKDKEEYYVEIYDRLGRGIITSEEEWIELYRDAVDNKVKFIKNLIYKQKKLGGKIDTFRRSYNSGTMKKETFNKLMKISHWLEWMKKEPIIILTNDQFINLYSNAYEDEKEGNFQITMKCVYNKIKFGVRLSKYRDRYIKGELNDEFEEKLSTIQHWVDWKKSYKGFVSDSNFITELKKLSDSKVKIQKNKEYNGIKIEQKLKYYLELYNKGILDKDVLKQLEKIDLWNDCIEKRELKLSEDEWIKLLNEAVSKKENIIVNAKYKYKNYTLGRKLNKWVQEYNNDKMKKELKDKLLNIPFFTNHVNKAFNDIKIYKKADQDVNTEIKTSSKYIYDGFALGSRINKWKSLYKNGTMKENIQQLLNEITHWRKWRESIGD